MADNETIAEKYGEVNKPCTYCEQHDFCPIANRGDMVADWCPCDNHDLQAFNQEVEQENNLPF